MFAPRTWALPLLVALISSGCAQPQKPRAKAKPAPDPIVATEKLAFDAEREINQAETSLAALQPDKALEHLDLAERSLARPEVDTYPDAPRLRERHLDLLKRVPDVREEVRKRELAAAVAAAKEKIEAAR